MKAVPTDVNVADLLNEASSGSGVLSKLGGRRVIASLNTRVEANHFDARSDHVATVSLAHEALVLALVVLAGAGACCCWRWCCRGTKAPARMPS